MGIVAVRYYTVPNNLTNNKIMLLWRFKLGRDDRFRRQMLSVTD